MLTLRDLRARSRREPNGCLVWLGQTMHGYGYVGGGRSGKYLRVHRVAWALYNGKRIPKGKMVTHTCDNRACVEARHLQLGTQASNMRDAVLRGRFPRITGENNIHSKLTQQEVDAIRRDQRSQRTIAAEYGVHQVTIGRIRRRQSWP